MGQSAIIVQARFASTRLPGKVLLDLAGRTVLWHVLQRCRAVSGVDIVCCATTSGADCNEVAREADRCGAVVFRGSEQDVLDRYYRAAKKIGADAILRVTSDCPLIDPGICGRVLSLVVEEGADYACNNMPAGWPHGLDCEAFTFEALERAAHSAVDSYQREHVTPWLRTLADLKKANLPGPGGALAEQRWTLDLPEDLAFFRALFAELPPPPMIPTIDQAQAVLTAHPKIVSLNASHRNVSRPIMPRTGNTRPEAK